GELSRREGLPRSWQSTRLMAYAPEKSATLACLDDSGTVVAYAKVSAHDQAAQDYHRYRTLSESASGHPHLRLPRPLAYLSQCHLLLIETIDGRRMNDPTGVDAVPDAAGFGAALAAFHGLEPYDAPLFTRFAPARLSD